MKASMRMLARPFVLGLALLAWAVPARATEVPRLTDEELVAASSQVLEARVESVTSAWNPARNQIFSFVDLSVGEVLKGTTPGPRLRLRLLGGSADGITMSVIDGPTFAVGERALLCLGPNPQSLFPIVGLSQGKLTFERDPVTGVERVRGRAITRETLMQNFRDLTK